MVLQSLANCRMACGWMAPHVGISVGSFAFGIFGGVVGGETESRNRMRVYCELGWFAGMDCSGVVLAACSWLIWAVSDLSWVCLGFIWLHVHLLL